MYLYKLKKNIQKKFNYFYKLSLLHKLFIFFMILILICIFNNKFKIDIENFDNKDKFIIKYGDQIYDKFYVDNYNKIFLDEKRNMRILEEIYKLPGEKNILDIGCGTGFIVYLLSKNFNVIGIDKSKYMTDFAKQKYSIDNFKTEDFFNINTMNYNKFTHIVCVNRTIYEFKDKKKFFDICNDLLEFNGFLIIDLIDNYEFKPFIMRDQNKILHNPEKYDMKITQIVVKLSNDLEFVSKYKLKNSDSDTDITNYTNKGSLIKDLKSHDDSADLTYFQEFKNFKTNKIRKNQLYLYIPEKKYIINLAKSKGFSVYKIKSFKDIGYKHENLYLFQKTM